MVGFIGFENLDYGLSTESMCTKYYEKIITNNKSEVISSSYFKENVEKSKEIFKCHMNGYLSNKTRDIFNEKK